MTRNRSGICSGQSSSRLSNDELVVIRASMMAEVVSEIQEEKNKKRSVNISIEKSISLQSALNFAKSEELNNHYFNLTRKISLLLATIEIVNSIKENEKINAFDITAKGFFLKEKWDKAGENFAKLLLEQK